MGHLIRQAMNSVIMRKCMWLSCNMTPPKSQKPQWLARTEGFTFIPPVQNQVTNITHSYTIESYRRMTLHSKQSYPSGVVSMEIAHNHMPKYRTGCIVWLPPEPPTFVPLKRWRKKFWFFCNRPRRRSSKRDSTSRFGVSKPWIKWPIRDYFQFWQMNEIFLAKADLGRSSHLPVMMTSLLHGVVPLGNFIHTAYLDFSDPRAWVWVWFLLGVFDKISKWPKSPLQYYTTGPSSSVGRAQGS